MEWANRLSDMGHETGLYCSRTVRRPEWFRLKDSVPVFNTRRQLEKYDTWIICSPHDIRLARVRPSKKVSVFLFLQMREDLFRPDDRKWQELCQEFYDNCYPLITISKWIFQDLRKMFPSRGPMKIVSNGVNLRDFPLEPGCRKDSATILVEGWNALNPTKDVDRIAPRVASILKQRGYRILAYSQTPLKDYPDAADGFYCLPTIEELNFLYRRASILLKASRFDARSCSPMEAMTKGTVTVRAIEKGDDDLCGWYNCVRVPYDFQALLAGAETLLGSSQLWEKLSVECLKYVEKNSWDRSMPRIEELLRCPSAWY